MQTKTTLAEDNQANSEGEINLDEGLEDSLRKESLDHYNACAATMLRKPGVVYELKLIKGSGGQLGLVEVPPEPSFFVRWFLAFGNALQYHDHFV
ncbi:MAG: hypothetical protein P8N67_03410 [Pseudomonadales bacterium]|nr:hypothetical protein [Pseudomonadales bacterium]